MTVVVFEPSNRRVHFLALITQCSLVSTCHSLAVSGYRWASSHLPHCSSAAAAVAAAAVDIVCTAIRTLQGFPDDRVRWIQHRNCEDVGRKSANTQIWLLNIQLNACMHVVCSSPLPKTMCSYVYYIDNLYALKKAPRLVTFNNTERLCSLSRDYMRSI